MLNIPTTLIKYWEIKRKKKRERERASIIIFWSTTVS